MISALYDWNWPVAEAQFKRAISMNPGYSTAHHWFGVHLCAMGRFDEGRKELETALNLDPLSPPVNENFGFPAFYQHHYPEAAKIFQRTLEIDTNFAPAHEDLMTIFDLQGDSKSASREAVLWLQSDGKGELAGIVKRDATEHGYRIALSNWLHSFEAKNDQYVSPMAPAKLSVRLGKTDEAFFWFDKAVEQRSPELVYLGVDPLYDSIRSDPRFKRILQRVGLTK
jgi:tetratricopeptide (TPR) repeat protein